MKKKSSYSGILQKLHIGFISLLVFVSISCETDIISVPERDSRTELTFNDIELKISEEDYISALGKLQEMSYSYLEYDNEKWDQLWDQVLNQAINHLQNNFLTLSETELIKYYQTIKILNPEKNISYADYHNRLFDIYYSSKNNSLVNTNWRSSLMASSLSNNQLLQLDSSSNINNQFSNDTVLRDQFASRYLNRPSGTISKPAKEDLLSGAVTIWVNQGMHIENGIGRTQNVIGSGFFIDSQGYIITNYHVIYSEVDPEYDGYSRLYIRLSDDSPEKIPARVVGWDPIMDLALLKVEIEPPYTFTLASEDDLAPGDPLTAIGSPGGLNNTLTSGAVSSLGRNLTSLGTTVQIDVPINPGNSGGPLLNGNDEVVGVIFAGIEQFEGVNFAIPVSYLIDILPALYRGGKVEYSWLGGALLPDLDRLELAYITPDSPIDRYGFQEGDSIITVNDIEINNVTELQSHIATLPPGTFVKIGYLRDYITYEKIVALEKRPLSPSEYSLNRDSRQHLFVPLFGMEIISIDTRQNKRLFKIEKVYPGTVADESGFSADDTFQIYKWEYLPEFNAVVIQISIRSQKAGFFENTLQIGSYVETNIFF